MLFAKAGDHLGARGVAIAEDAGDVGFATDRVHHILREGFFAFRKIAPVEHHRRAGDFPMTRWRVLAARDFACRTMQAEDPVGHGHAIGRFAGCEFGGLDQAECRHVRQDEWTLPQPLAVAGASRTELGDVAQRIGAVVAIGGRIRSTTDTEGIENEKECTCHVNTTAGSGLLFCRPLIASLAPGRRLGKRLRSAVAAFDFGAKALTEVVFARNGEVLGFRARQAR